MIISQSDFATLDMDMDGWNILVVDDDQGVVDATEFVLEDMKIAGLPLRFITASSMQKGQDVLRERNDIAVILLDVVMESNDAGLQMVEFIRDELQNQNIRILLRTGQPGYAPESEVVQNYDIDDYLSKSDLSDVRLITSVTSAIRAYVHMMALDYLQQQNRELLQQRENEISEIEQKIETAPVPETQPDFAAGTDESALFAELLQAGGSLFSVESGLEKLGVQGSVAVDESLLFEQQQIVTAMLFVVSHLVESSIEISRLDISMGENRGLKFAIEFSDEVEIEGEIWKFLSTRFSSSKSIVLSHEINHNLLLVTAESSTWQ